MTKRCLSLILVLPLILVLIHPVFASDFDGNTIELLEYDSVNEDGNMFYASSATTIGLDCPQYGPLRYIDITFRTNGTAAPSVDVKYNSTYQALSVVQIETGYYRAFGLLTGYYADVQIRFTPPYAMYITLESVKVRRDETTYYVCDADVKYTGLNLKGTYSTSYNITDPGNGDLNNVVPSNYQAQINVYDWQSYDRLVVWGSVTSASIASVRASLHTIQPLSCTVSYFVPTAAGEWVADGDNQTTATFGKYLYCAEIDLSELDRTSEQEVRIYMTGTYDSYIGMTFNCQYVNGYVDAADTSSVSWWNRFTEFMTGLFGADNPDADDFASDMESQATEFGEMVDDLDSVTKPPVGDVDVDLSDVVSDDDIAGATTPLVGILSNSLFLSMALISLTLGLIAYVIYGKR